MGAVRSPRPSATARMLWIFVRSVAGFGWIHPAASNAVDQIVAGADEHHVKQIRRTIGKAACVRTGNSSSTAAILRAFVGGQRVADSRMASGDGSVITGPVSAKVISTPGGIIQLRLRHLQQQRS